MSASTHGLNRGEWPRKSPGARENLCYSAGGETTEGPRVSIHEEHDTLVSPSRPVRRIDTLKDGSLKAAGGTSMTVDT